MDDRPGDAPPPPPDLTAPPAEGFDAEGLPPYAPPVPPSADVAAADTGDDRDRFRTIIAALIAITSILGAVVAWRASVSSTAAGDLDEQATQELVLQEQELASLEGLVANDLRLFGQYQEHILSWRILLKQADTARKDNVALADQLKAEGLGELSLARSLRAFFQGATPTFGDADGKVVYDRDFVLANLKENDQELKVLRPDVTFENAESEHDRTVKLVAVFTLVIVALFFLTIAQFARENVRTIFAIAGVAIAIGGLAGFVIVETGIA